MQAGSRPIALDDRLIQAADCEHEFACLGDASFCRTDKFLNRDVEVVRCLSGRQCARRRGFDGMQICTCPVKHRLHGLS